MKAPKKHLLHYHKMIAHYIQRILSIFVSEKTPAAGELVTFPGIVGGSVNYPEFSRFYLIKLAVFGLVQKSLIISLVTFPIYCIAHRKTCYSVLQMFANTENTSVRPSADFKVCTCNISCNLSHLFS